MSYFTTPLNQSIVECRYAVQDSLSGIVVAYCSTEKHAIEVVTALNHLLQQRYTKTRPPKKGSESETAAE
jgi:hypothetical protein